MGKALIEAGEQEQMEGPLRRFGFYLRQRPVMLVLLAVLAAAFFLTVTGLSRAYQAQRTALGNRWFERGIADLNAHRYDAAVTNFRAALIYSRDNYTYQMNLAEALIGLRHTGEAAAYLLNLWERQPEDGLVNLELARISAQTGKTDQAARYYHNAIYAAWPRDAETKRRDARLELIDLLLRTNAKAQAQAELIALAENEADYPTQQKHLAERFIGIGDYEDALAAYRQGLNNDPRYTAALAGAGQAAFRLGRYTLAERYLRSAVAVDPNDKQSEDLLRTAEMVLRMDPFQRQISVDERNRIVAEDFAIAGNRLRTCAASVNGASAGTGSNLSAEWSASSPHITQRELQRDPDAVERAMDLVFRVERQTSTACGTPTGPDLALLLISKLHEGNSF